MENASWEHFAHEADMGVRGFGFSKERAFENGALAMTAVITNPEAVRPQEVIDVCCDAPDDELLFVAWLNALVSEMATRNMLFSKFEVTIAEQQLKGKAWGEKVDVTRHQPAVEVKGATYTALRVKQNTKGHWVAQCVVDV
jgi:tRNA nucleotidyltransferase (CCA-adding enzyme)